MTNITFGDKMGSKVMTLKPFITRKLHCRGICFVSCYYIFLFERVYIIHMAYKVFHEYISVVSLSIWPFVSLLFVHVRPPARPFVYF